MYGFADNMCITLSFVILASPFHVGRPLHPFAAVKNLYFSEESVLRIARAWGRTTGSSLPLNHPLKYTNGVVLSVHTVRAKNSVFIHNSSPTIVTRV
jgi:hypothetical protein